MKFKIVRTSLWNDEKPCEEEGIKKEEYLSTYGGKRMGWFLDINSLEELVKFYEKYGELIVTTASANEKIQEIEIYDSYRE